VNSLPPNNRILYQATEIYETLPARNILGKHLINKVEMT
jgi:hypothetical protein